MRSLLTALTKLELSVDSTMRRPLGSLLRDHYRSLPAELDADGSEFLSDLDDREGEDSPLNTISEPTPQTMSRPMPFIGPEVFLSISHVMALPSGRTADIGSHLPFAHTGKSTF